MEPFSCAVYACQRANVTAGSQVFISGAGAIGLLCLVAAKSMGAASVCITGKYCVKNLAQLIRISCRQKICLILFYFFIFRHCRQSSRISKPTWRRYYNKCYE